MVANKAVIGWDALQLAGAVVRRWNSLDETSKDALRGDIEDLMDAVSDVRHASFAYAGRLRPHLRERVDERLLKKAKAPGLDVQIGRRVLNRLLVSRGAAVATEDVAGQLSLSVEDKTLRDALSQLEHANLIHRQDDTLSFRTVEVWYEALPALRHANLHERMAKEYAVHLAQHGVLAVGAEGFKEQETHGLRGRELKVAVGAALSFGLAEHGMEWYGQTHGDTIVGLPQELLESFTEPVRQYADNSLEALTRSVQRLLNMADVLWKEMSPVMPTSPTFTNLPNIGELGEFEPPMKPDSTVP